MHHYVVPATDLNVLPSLPADYPRPIQLEWINRGTNHRLKTTTILMLIRTLYSEQNLSGSVQRLQASAGLRLRFACDRDRARFQAQFEGARRSRPKKR